MRPGIVARNVDKRGLRRRTDAEGVAVAESHIPIIVKHSQLLVLFRKAICDVLGAVRTSIIHDDYLEVLDRRVNCSDQAVHRAFEVALFIERGYEYRQ